MEENEIIYSDIPVTEEHEEITVDEIMPVIEIAEIESYEIEMQEAFPSTEGNNSYNHALLNNREIHDAHPISAITGLREELNDIEALKTVYSDKKGNADYYEWAEGYVIDGVGRFVTLNKDTRTITICTGDDIFGVVVDNAAFVGGQDDVARDGRYGLVATSGAVHVRCELDVEEGNYVVSNSRGIATKTTSNYGYKVVALHDIDGLAYATISLDIAADQVDSIGKKLQNLDGRVDANYNNIISATNLATLAYDRATRIGVSNQEMSNKVDGALGKVDQMASDVANMGEQVSNSVVISTQAQAIANNTSTYVTTEVNKSLDEISQFRDELTDLSTDINIQLENTKENIESTRQELQGNIDDAVRDFEKLEEDLKPLATWSKDNKTGVAGFVAKVNEDGSVLADIVSWKDGDGPESLAGVISSATAENTNVMALANYTYKDKDGKEHNSVAAIDARAKDNEASIEAIVGTDGSLAGIQTQVDKNAASVNTLTSHIVGDYISFETWDQTKANIGTIYYVKDTQDYYYYDEDEWKHTKKPYKTKPPLTGALTGVQQTADNNAANIEMITKLEGDFGKSLAGFVANASMDSSEVKALVEQGWKDDDNTIHHGTAGIMALVDANKTSVDLISKSINSTYKVLDEWKKEDRKEDEQNIIFYAKNEQKYYYYADGDWQSTDKASVAGLHDSIAAIQVETDKNSSSINNLTDWRDETDISMTRIEQKADANGAYIQNTVVNIDKYTVGSYSQAYGFTLRQAKSVLEPGVIYTPTEEVTESYIIDNEPIVWFEDDGKNIKNCDRVYYKINEGIREYWYYNWDEKMWMIANHADKIPSTLPRKFSPGYLYKWGELENGSYGWTTVDKNYNKLDKINTSTMSVLWSPREIVIYKDDPNNQNYGYWYATPNENGEVLDKDGNSTEKYQPYTLYKWDLPYKYQIKDENGNDKDIEEYHWIAVATLAGNASNRAVSQIRQDTNSIELRVTNTEGNVAAVTAAANATGASVSQIVAAVGEDGKVNAASIVSAVNNAGSDVIINADRIKLQASSINIGGTLLDYINNFEVGGRNLYTGTADFSGNKWENIDLWQTDSNLDSFGNVIKYKDAWYGLYQIVSAKVGDTFTLSATLFGDGKCNASFIVTDGGDRTSIKTYNPESLSTSGTRAFATYTVKTDGEFTFRIENTVSDSVIKLSSMKLERGTVATDWTPAPEDTATDMGQIVVDFNTDIANLQSQIDGSITTWFYEVAPTLENGPAKNWVTTEDKNTHLGDLYYDTQTGYCYRWQIKNNIYSWERITDTDVTKALEDAKNAQDTADGKRRVFTSTPTPPYDSGDLWVQGTNGDIMRCQTSKAKGATYAASDWVKASKYTDDSAVNNFITNTYAQDLLGIQGQIDGKAETWYQSNDPSTSWTTNTAKAAHKGDLWFKTSDNTTWYWNGSQWQEQAAPKEVFDAIDGVASIYTTIPTKPVTGDLLIPATDNGSYKAGKVYKYDGTTWSEIKYTDDTAVNNLNIGGRNLLYDETINHSGVIINSYTNNNTTKMWNITKTDGYSGTRLSQNVFKTGETYTLSYFFKGTSGTLKNIGGHSTDFKFHKIILDGEIRTEIYSDGIPLNESGNGFKEHYLALTFTVKSETSADDNFYIQPNRGLDTAITYDLWNIQLEKGDKATAWTVAPEDMASKTNVIACINVSGETATIAGNKVNILGNATFSSLTATENNTTVIDGGKIKTGTITSDQLNTNAIQSNNYTSGVIGSLVPSQGYSVAGTYMDLSDGNIYSQNFNIRGGNVEMKGHVEASSGDVGGFVISPDNISSGSEKLFLGADGNIIAQNIEANIVKASAIGSRLVNYDEVANDDDEENGAWESVPVLYFEGGEPTENTYSISCYPHKKYTTDNGHQYISIHIKNSAVNTVSLLRTIAITVTYEYEENNVSVTRTSVCRTVSGSGITEAYIGKPITKIIDYNPKSITILEGGSTSIRTHAHIIPEHNSRWTNVQGEQDGYTLGDEDHEWKDIYSRNSHIGTSDRNKKNTISPLTDKHSEVFDKLTPVTYKFNQNTSDRLHLGLIAQDVKQAIDEVGIDSKDFAAYCEWKKEDGTIGCGLRYGEFIAMCIYEIQKLKAQVKELESKLSEEQHDET